MDHNFDSSFSMCCHRFFCYLLSCRFVPFGNARSARVSLFVVCHFFCSIPKLRMVLIVVSVISHSLFSFPLFICLRVSCECSNCVLFCNKRWNVLTFMSITIPWTKPHSNILFICLVDITHNFHFYFEKRL